MNFLNNDIKNELEEIAPVLAKQKIAHPYSFDENQSLETLFLDNLKKTCFAGTYTIPNSDYFNCFEKEILSLVNGYDATELNFGKKTNPYSIDDNYFEHFSNDIITHVKQNDVQPKILKLNNYKTWIAAASVFLLISFAAFLFWPKSNANNDNLIASLENIKNGKDLFKTSLNVEAELNNCSIEEINNFLTEHEVILPTLANSLEPEISDETEENENLINDSKEEKLVSEDEKLDEELEQLLNENGI